MSVSQLSREKPVRVRTLPVIEPRLLSREEAAHYVGIGTTFFDKLVAEKKLPSPISIGARKLWDRRDLDASIQNMKDAGSWQEQNPWDA